jgi:ribosomal-protein-serine acetyltransferase
MNDIRIRFYKLDDVNTLYEAARESISNVYQWLPWCHPQYTIEESKKWIADQIQKRQNKLEFEFVILDNNDIFLGGCGLNQIDWDRKSANLGYWVRSSAMGEGVAVKAVQLLSKWGFENTDLARLEIKCAIENVRSQRVAEKAGANKEGIKASSLELHGKKHDAIIYSLKK